MKLEIEKRHLAIVKEILDVYSYGFFAFGSRVAGKSRKFSDLDLFFIDDIAENIVQKIEADFEESDLPFKVDLVNYNKLDQEFKRSIGENYMSIQQSSVIGSSCFINLPNIKLVGIKARTNNNTELTTDAGKIGPTVQKFFGEFIQNEIPNRKNPGTVFSVYTEYDSNEGGDYTYFIGEEVTSFSDVPANLETLTIPAQHYKKFTSNPGKMPNVVIDMWKNIWLMKKEDFGSERAYIADFEIFDVRAADPENSVVDIYVGITS